MIEVPAWGLKVHSPTSRFLNAWLGPATAAVAVSLTGASGRLIVGAVGGASRRPVAGSVVREMPRGHGSAAASRDASTASTVELAVVISTAAIAKRPRGSTRSTACSSPTPRGVTVTTPLVPTVNVAAVARLLWPTDQAETAKQARQRAMIRTRVWRIAAGRRTIWRSARNIAIRSE